MDSEIARRTLEPERVQNVFDLHLARRSAATCDAYNRDLRDFAKWLNAELVESEWRPIGHADAFPPLLIGL